MSINVVLRFFGIGQKRSTEPPRHTRTSARPGTGPFILPVYSPLSPVRVPSPSRGAHAERFDLNKAGSATTVTATFGEADIVDEAHRDASPTRHLLHEDKQDAPSPNNRYTLNISLRSFLANFTLGYSDGLTVPFALTAGLSWLGSSHMVITAGSAEICAGCISMGIGGYLAAKGEKNAAERELAALALTVEAEAQSERLSNASSSDGEEEGAEPRLVKETERSQDALLAKYIAPLNLPSHLAAMVMAHAAAAGLGSSKSIVATDVQIAGSATGSDEDGGKEDNSAGASPVMAGLSVALGYLLGGLLPLFPYFFVDEVKQGLVWSFAVCLVALFLFGFLKEFVMCVEHVPQIESDDYDDYYGAAWDAVTSSPRKVWWGKQWLRRARIVSSRDVRLSLREGLLMAGLGGVAAVAAVLCVMLSQVATKEPEHGSS